jgi:hypothetical protein
MHGQQSPTDAGGIQFFKMVMDFRLQKLINGEMNKDIVFCLIFMNYEERKKWKYEINVAGKVTR